MPHGKWTVRIDGFHPARVNELLGMHWAAAGRRKKADARVIQVACATIPKAKGKRRVTLEWVMGPRNKVKPDADGVWKSLLDALVHCGKLVDDHSDYLDCAPVVFSRAKVKGIVLTVEEA